MIYYKALTVLACKVNMHNKILKRIYEAWYITRRYVYFGM